MFKKRAQRKVEQIDNRRTQLIAHELTPGEEVVTTRLAISPQIQAMHGKKMAEGVLFVTAYRLLWTPEQGGGVLSIPFRTVTRYGVKPCPDGLGVPKSQFGCFWVVNDELDETYDFVTSSQFADELQVGMDRVLAGWRERTADEGEGSAPT